MSLPFKNHDNETVVEMSEDGTFRLKSDEPKEYPDVFGRECTSSLSQSNQPIQKADKADLPWGSHPDERRKRNRPGFADRG